MWGNIVLEVSFLSNYHLGFNNTKTDILIHLTQWQYWWWFWFSYLWGLYFLLFLRILRFRTLKFKPKIATTLRPRGKWGDLIVCLIPISWCVNIITNSNLILRMIEWQAESSLFTIRIRGKQWYWVYKYDLKTVTDVLSTPKNIGNNKWQVNTPGDLIVADNYLSILQLRSYNKWCLKYWKTLIPKVLKEENYSPLISNHEQLNALDLKKLKKTTINNTKTLDILNKDNYVNFFLERDLFKKKSTLDNIKPTPHWRVFFFNLTSTDHWEESGWDKIKKLFLTNTDGKRITKISNPLNKKGYPNYESWIDLLKVNPKIYNKKWSNLNKLTAVHDWKTWENYVFKRFKLTSNTNEEFNTYLKLFIKNKNKKWIWSKISVKKNTLLGKVRLTDYAINNKELKYMKNYLTTKINLKKNSISHDNLQEVNRSVRRSHGTISPCRLIKLPISNQIESFSNLNENTNIELLRFRFNDKISNIHHKPFSHNNFLIMRQKRYKRIKLMPLRIKKTRDELTGIINEKSKTIYSKNMQLIDNVFFEEATTKKINLKYKLIKKYKKHSEHVPLTLWKRLLRTKRTLVLPAHVNITAITNSFDVVHSWFLPGLGLKLDCVPGRATHHVIHIDSVGFYYGQCAEICGRYHHHMPIRVCALPFEHFLIWWHSFGVPKLLFSNTDQKYLTKNYALRKYTW